jgi:hypothetical protein
VPGELVRIVADARIMAAATGRRLHESPRLRAPVQ